MAKQSQGLEQWTPYLEAIRDILIPMKKKPEKEAKSAEGEAAKKETAKLMLPPIYTHKLVTIVGMKTTVGRFLPVSHEGDSIETYVDKVVVLGAQRAEFIARKLKATERRAHMRMFRELAEQKTSKDWEAAFKGWLNKRCEIPNALCALCWNCSLFGSLNTSTKESERGATFARTRYFDTYSIEPVSSCIAQMGSDEGMAIGNTVDEDLSKNRGEASFHMYEYVKPDTHFPFITIIEGATLLDVAGLLNAQMFADLHGHGKYSANNGKFQTEVWAVSAGVPKFSVLDMLAKADAGGVDGLRQWFTGKTAPFENPLPVEGKLVPTLWSEEVDTLRGALTSEFDEYIKLLSKLK